MRAVLYSKGNHDFGSSNFLQTILAQALAERLYERHLPKIAAAYRRKRDAMIEELERVERASRPLPKTKQRTGETPVLRFNKPLGGLYVWLELDARMKTGAKSGLFRRAFDAGVLYVPGEMCYCQDSSRPIPQNCIRLSFGAPTVEQIRKGIRLLARNI